MPLLRRSGKTSGKEEEHYRHHQEKEIEREDAGGGELLGAEELQLSRS